MYNGVNEMADIFENIYNKAVDEQKKYPSDKFPTVEGIRLEQIINRQFVIKDARMGTVKAKNNDGVLVDKETVHILIEIDGTNKVFITGAYRIVTSFRYLIGKDDIGAIIGTNAMVYQIGAKEGYNIKTVD